MLNLFHVWAATFGGWVGSVQSRAEFNLPESTGSSGQRTTLTMATPMLADSIVFLIPLTMSASRVSSAWFEESFVYCCTSISSSDDRIQMKKRSYNLNRNRQDKVQS